MLTIRPAQEADAPLVLEFIRELARYERAPNAVVATIDGIIRDGFTPGRERFQVLIAEWEQKPAGFAFYFFNYSTWMGKRGLYLEDLFVRPVHRGKGIGKALLAELAKVAVREGCYGMRWQVLDWNTPAIEFYESLGGTMMKEWLTVRLMGEPLKALAAQSRNLARPNAKS